MSAARLPHKPQGIWAQARALIPLYAAIWVVVLCALLALGSVLDDERLLAFALVATTLGFAVSLTMRLWRVEAAVPLAAGGAWLLLTLVFQLPARDLTSLGTGSIVASILPALILCGGLTVFSFCLVDDDLLLFVIPPSLAIISLAGTENPNPELTGLFLVFVIAAIFAVCYQNYLCYVPPERAGQSRAALWPVLRWQLVSASAVFGLVAVLTMAVTLPLKSAGFIRAYNLRVPGSSLLEGLIDMGFSAMGRDLQMGVGPPVLSDRVVFRVESPEAAYWRCRTYDDYNGRGWSDTSGTFVRVAQPESRSGRWAVSLEGDRLARYDWRTPYQELRQKISFESSWPSQALPAAANPVGIIFQRYPGSVRETSANAVLLAGPQLPAGLEYEVVSRVPQATPTLLRSRPDADPDSPRLMRYLRVPNTVWKVEALAARIVRGYTNNFDRAQAIERYLSSTYTYNLDVEPVPPEEDVVTHFLFTAREGYCDLFASAMVVMCRLVNIPARLAAGFATGIYDPERRCYVVREMDAHAWVEVYFPGCGWVAFDPTPAAREAVIESLEPKGFFSVLRGLGRRITFPVVLLLTGAILLANLARLTLYHPWRQRRAARHLGNCGPRGEVLQAYYTVCEVLGRFLPRRSDQTPIEYYRWIEEHAPGATWLPVFERLTRQFLWARFADAPVTPSQGKEAQEQMARLLAAIRKDRHALQQHRLSSSRNGLASRRRGGATSADGRLAPAPSESRGSGRSASGHLPDKESGLPE